MVVGSVNVDFVVRVDRLPAPGETVTGGSFEQHHGGKGANQAVAAARLGAHVTFVGAVGDDDPGRSALAALEREGIDVSRTAVLDGEPTGVALIVVDGRGENQIAVASGANTLLTAEVVCRALDSLPSGLGVYLANQEVPEDAVITGARAAKRGGMTVVVNPAPARALSDDLLDLAPILVANQLEARALSGEASAIAAARALAGRTGRAVVVTLGGDGALIVEHPGDEPITIRAPSVATVDATGAGDTFAGAFAAELASGARPRAATEFAVAAASLSVTAAGARSGMPTRDQVEMLLRSTSGTNASRSRTDRRA